MPRSIPRTSRNLTAVVNSKGGTTKSTLVFGLAGALAERGRSVLLVDFDPQASLTKFFDCRETTGDGQLKSKLLLDAVVGGHDLNPFVLHLEQHGIDLIPNGPGFSSYDFLVMNSALRCSRDPRRVIATTFGRFDYSRWDHVIVDTPGSFGEITVGTLVAADYAIVPTPPDETNVEELPPQIDAIAEVREELNPDLKILGIVISRFDTRLAIAHQFTDALREHYGTHVYDTVLNQNVSIQEAAGAKKPVTAYEPKSRGAEDYRALADEFEARLAALRKEEQRREEEKREVANV